MTNTTRTAQTATVAATDLVAAGPGKVPGAGFAVPLDFGARALQTGHMTNTYATITDLGNLEVRDAIMGDDAVASLEPAQVDVALDRVTSLLLERGLVVWEDGYDEATDTTYLNHEGFRMNLDEALEGADFWEAVSDALSEVL